MTTRFQVLLGLFAFVLLVGGGCAAIAPADNSGERDEDRMEEKMEDKTAEEGPIKIGWVGPLTGDAVIYGEPVKNATELAVKKINERGGIAGRQVEVIYEDGFCNGKEAAAAAQKLINVEKVDYILGGICSGEVLAMAPITEEAKMLLFSPTATSPDISSAGDFIFRNIPADDGSGVALADVVFNDDFRKVAIVSEQTDFAEGVRKVFVERFEKIGGEIVLDEKYAPNTKDFRGVITKAKASDAEVFVINPQTVISGGPMAKQLRELDSDLPIYTTSVMADDTFLGIAESAAEGAVIVDVPGLAEENPIATAFLQEYRKMHGEEPSFAFYAGSGYDGPFILKEAIEAVGTDTEAIRDYFYGIENYSGVIGNYGFDENGDLVGIEYVMREVKNGEIVLR